MPIEPERETVQRIGWILTALLFLLAIVSAVGEYLGWFNDIGEIGMTVGTLGGLFVGFATLISGADSSEVHAVHEAVNGNGDKLDSIDTKLDKLDRLDSVDTKLDDLDRVQLELDKQTGVLEDIRDLL